MRQLPGRGIADQGVYHDRNRSAEGPKDCETAGEERHREQAWSFNMPITTDFGNYFVKPSLVNSTRIAAGKWHWGTPQFAPRI